MKRGELREYWDNYEGDKVPLKRFWKRCYCGWDRKRAISEKIGKSRGGSRDYVGKFQQVWEEIKEDVHPTLTKSHVQHRLWQGWNYKRAISQPLTYRRRGKGIK